MPIHPKPCGHRYCAAAYRIVWAEHDWTLDECAAAIGLTKGSVHRAGEMLDLPPRPRLRPPKRLSRRAVEKAWNGPFQQLSEAAASLGVSSHLLRYRALQVYGLAPRKWVNHATVKPCRWFAEMWAYNVSSKSLGEHIGCDVRVVFRIAERLGLDMGRPNDHRARKPTVADFMRDELPRVIIERQAQADQVALILRTRDPDAKLPSAQAAIIKRFIETRRAA